ncbi:enoyl-CoA hydratase, mitochondrial-like [Paramacrobiotus metropolitanus]|uniref:enoyl-CoA hydratase, mitochondrial-like n=1 Tax=Paramacrobiotus metropolitanus TaxID=2943436 RepID=UPI00244596C2|nr:enoyl-CoA hydratase, mitochondrial-like [Paramacrobiotus metropolitanus]
MERVIQPCSICTDIHLLLPFLTNLFSNCFLLLLVVRKMIPGINSFLLRGIGKCVADGFPSLFTARHRCAYFASSANQTLQPKEHENADTSFQNVIVCRKGSEQNVGYIQLNRPKQHNAISYETSKELHRALEIFENDDNIGAVVYTGGERIFTVGADITQMEGMSFLRFFRTFQGDFSAFWDKLYTFRKPIIAAVNGYCVGGGTETIMMCDIVYAGERAQFGQPEINIGTLPGAGGTQRLTRAVGKSKAMEMILTGQRITASEAEAWGLVSKVFPPGRVIPEAISLAEKIAKKPRIAVLMAKEAVKASEETSLKQGLLLEGVLSCATRATKDFHEGMTAFVSKRPPKFQD